MRCLGYIVARVYERSFIFSTKVQKETVEHTDRMHGIHRLVYTWPKVLKVTPGIRTVCHGNAPFQEI